MTRLFSTILPLLLTFNALCSNAAPTIAERRGPRLADCPIRPTLALPSSSLPPPDPSLSLKYVYVGRGTQNYTCETSMSSPVAAGAVATLYDASCLLRTPGTQSQLHNLIVPAMLSVASDAIQSFIAVQAPAADSALHYFRADGTPFFDINSGDFIAAAKDANVPAPPGATGNENGPAIDWLKLSRKPGEPDGNIQQVFRVITAGGAAPKTCSQPGPLSIEYVAEYWMYG